MTIYVFGSCNVDFVTRIAKHPAPGETILAPEHKLFSGGKGANQAVAAAKAGANVHMIGAIGQDHLGDFILSSLNNAHVGTKHITRNAALTGCAFISVDAQGENTIIVSAGANLLLKSSDFPLQNLTSQDWVLFQMEVTPEQNWAAILKVKSQGGHVILNLAPATPVPLDILPKLDILVVNIHEIEALRDFAPLNEHTAMDLAKWAATTFQITVVLTLGKTGAFTATPNDTFLTPAPPIQAVDTVGAGDCFTGYLASGLHQNMPLHESLKLAVAAGSLACTIEGAQQSMPLLSDVIHFLDEGGTHATCE
ncbi:MAG: ribokinase [Alphaproteobacteria bacterium]|nr:ribokinase [Alphaproteobacteria bacterium]